mgnify:CR=1 FL=1
MDPQDFAKSIYRNIPKEVTEEANKLTEEEARLLAVKTFMQNLYGVPLEERDEYIKMRFILLGASFVRLGTHPEFFDFAVDCITVAPDKETKLLLKQHASVINKGLLLSMRGEEIFELFDDMLDHIMSVTDVDDDLVKEMMNDIRSVKGDK